jgi:hypothetical protein
MNELLIPNARLYAARHQLELAESLGSGKDGIVLVAKHKAKPADVAIKVLRFDHLAAEGSRLRLGLFAAEAHGGKPIFRSRAMNRTSERMGS